MKPDKMQTFQNIQEGLMGVIADQTIMIHRGNIIIILYKDCVITLILERMLLTNSRKQYQVLVYLPIQQD